MSIALGLATVFSASAVGGLLLHLDTEPSRRITQELVNDLLGSIFDGKIVSGPIESIGLDGVHIRDAVAVDPRGEVVIRASELRASADVPAMVSDVLFGEGPLVIKIPLIRIEHAEVLVHEGPHGELTIAETFTPRETPKKPETKKPKAPSRPVRVTMSRIEIGTGWVHGEVAPPRALDADVRRLVGAVFVREDGVDVDVNQTGLLDRTFLPAPTAGTANYHLRVDSKPGPVESDVRMWTSFVGRIGRIPTGARLELDNGYLKAHAEVPSSTPEEIASLIDALPLQRPAGGTIELEGQIPSFSMHATVELEGHAGAHELVRAEGRLDASGPLRVDLALDVEGLNPRSLADELPDARMFASGLVTFETSGSLPRLQADVTTSSMMVDGELIPATDAHVVLDRGRWIGSASVHESGMPIEGLFVLEPEGEVAFFASGDVERLANVPRFAAARVDASGTVAVRGRYGPRGIDAEVTGVASSVRAPGKVALATARVSGTVQGPLNDLEVQASLEGEQLRAGTYAFDRVRAQVLGPVLGPTVTADLSDPHRGRLKAKGQLDPVRGTATGVSFTMERQAARVVGEVRRLGPTTDGVDVEGIVLKGNAVGEVAGDLRIAGGEITGTIRADGIRVAQLATLLGSDMPIDGLANVDIQLARTKDGRKGHVLVELVNGSVLIIPGISAQVAAHFDGQDVTMDGLVRLVARAEDAEAAARLGLCDGTIAEVQVSNGVGKLQGRLLDPRSWLEAEGSVDVAAEDWSLRCLAELVPFGLPFSRLDGSLTTRLSLSRDPGERFASVDALYLRTRGLEVIGPEPFGADRPEWASEHIDVQLEGSFDGQTGRLQQHTILFDGAILAEARGTAELDLPRLADGEDPVREVLAQTPISANLSVPRRSIAQFSTLPTMLAERLPPVAGEVRFDAFVDGTAEEPFIVATTLGFGLVADPSQDTAGDWTFPVDVETTSTYDAHVASIDAVISHEHRQIATINAQAEVELSDLYHHSPTRPAPWTGGVFARISDLPLAELPFLADRSIGGHVSGTIALAGLNDQPSLDVELQTTTLQLDPEYFSDATLKAQIRPVAGGHAERAAVGSIDAAMVPVERAVGNVVLKIEPPGGGDDEGVLSLQAYSGILWEDRLYPVIDPDAPADLSAVANEFSLIALSPFVAGTLSRLDGLVSGAVRVGWGRLREGEAGKVEARLRVHDGIVHIPQLGQEFREAKLTILTNPAGVIRFERFEAQGLSGRATGHALVRLDGLRPTTGRAELDIAEGEELPITFEGVPLGRARGHIVMDGELRKESLDLKAQVQKLDLRLPASSSRDVQSLEDHPDIAISHALGPEEQRRSESALPIRLAVELGDVRVRGAGFDMRLAHGEHRPTVVLTDRARVTGDVRLTSGTFEVMGKVFELQRGLVRLREEDISNPHLNVTAFWDPPGGGRVFVDYVGVLHPITNEKLKFRSTPQRPRKVILAALLFGADLLAPDEDSTQQAAGSSVAVGGELAAEELNLLLSGIAPLRGLSTRVGTTEEGRVKGSLVYQAGNTVFSVSSFQESSTGQPTGEQAAGTSSSTTQRTEVSADYRFHPTWILRGTFGGGASGTNSGIDLLWQFRY